MTPASMDNVHWFVAFREGDGAAFEDIFDQYNKPLFYTAFQYVNNEEEAKDIVADTFQKLWQGRQTFNDGEHVVKFLFTAIRNASLNYIKKTERRSIGNQELLSLLPLKEEDFSRKVIEAQLLQLVYNEVESLPPQCKAVFKKLFMEGASTEETATALGITTRNVLNQKQLAIKALKGKLGTSALIYFIMHMLNIYHK